MTSTPPLARRSSRAATSSRSTRTVERLTTWTSQRASRSPDVRENLSEAPPPRWGAAPLYTDGQSHNGHARARSKQAGRGVGRLNQTPVSLRAPGMCDLRRVGSITSLLSAPACLAGRVFLCAGHDPVPTVLSLSLMLRFIVRRSTRSLALSSRATGNGSVSSPTK